MPSCNNIIPIIKSCDDNNLGALNEIYIADYEDVLSFGLTGSTVNSITMATSSNFESFYFKKNMAFYTENQVVDFEADTHGWEQVITLNLRRIEVDKRDAIMVLAEGRRELVIITKSNNGDIRIFGSDAGLRLSGSESGSGENRASGSFYTLTFTAEIERYKGYDVLQATLDNVKS
jgi:hypothetical protein